MDSDRPETKDDVAMKLMEGIEAGFERVHVDKRNGGCAVCKYKRGKIHIELTMT